MLLSTDDLLDTQSEVCLVREYRDVQVNLAKEIEKALRSGKNVVSEAGTGAGKSFALLFPALLMRQRVVVSTNTKGLQAQYMGDLKMLKPKFKDLGIDFKYALAKGKANYVCEIRLRKEWAKTGKQKLELPKAFIEWRKKSVFQDRDEPELAGINTGDFWYKINAEDCIGVTKCQYAKTCGYAAAKEARDEAHVIIANHSITGFDIRFGHEKVLPPYKYLLLDEAHKAEEAFRRAFSTELTRNRVPKLLDWLSESEVFDYDHVKPHAIRHFDKMKAEEQKLAKMQLKKYLDIVDQSLESLERMNKQLFRGLVTVGKEGTTRLDREDIQMPLKMMHGELVKAQRFLFTMADVENGGDSFEQEKKNFYGAAKQGHAFETAVMASNKIDRLIDTLAILYDEDEETDPAVRYVSFSTDKKGHTHKKILHQPMNISGQLQNTLFPNHNVIATSATLSQGGDFTNFMSRLGFEEDKTIQYFALSPFDIENHSILYVSGSVPPHPSRDWGLKQATQKKKDAAYETYYTDMASEICMLLRSSSGHAFVLFSNRKEMEEIGTRVTEELEGEMNIRMQLEGSTPGELSSWFIGAEKPVLFGVKTFWEGISVEGDQLRMVIVAKVPYSPRGDLIVKERIDRAISAKVDAGMDEAKARAVVFREIDVVEMVWEMKQALGRLLRTMDDYGCAAILDRGIQKDWSGSKVDRNGNKRVGHILMDDLPYKKITMRKDEVVKFLRKFEAVEKRKQKKEQ